MKKPGHKPWTQEDEDALVALAPKFSTARIAARLKRSEGSIIGRANLRGIKLLSKRALRGGRAFGK